MPTEAQFAALINASNTEGVWKDGWTTLGGNNGGRLITSKVNGISLFFAAAGYLDGSLYYAGVFAKFWSSTPFSNRVYFLHFDGYGYVYLGPNGDRYVGYCVRPVQN